MKKNLLYTLLVLLFTLQATAQNKVSYTYDANNRLTQVVYPNGTTVKYTYDALGNRLSKKVATVQKQYTVSLSALPVEGGTVTGGGTFYEGQTIQIKAMENEGYKFVKWSDNNTNSDRYFVVSGNTTLVAQFAKQTEPTGLIGDVNGDGVINYDDAVYIRNAYLGMGLDTSNCDLDDDGQFNVVDVTIMNAILNGTYGNDGGNSGGDAEQGNSEGLSLMAKLAINNTNNEEVSKLVVGQTYKISFKIELAGSQPWKGRMFMKELSGTEILKEWNREYDPGDKANLTVTFVPQSTGKKTYAAYYQTEGSDKVYLVYSGEFANPVEMEVVESGPDKGSYLNRNYVDLGLPSGTLWATYNVGASKPEGLGNHYAWGETSGCNTKDEYQPRNYKYYDYLSDLYTKYFVQSSSEGVNGIVDGLKVLLPEDDAATVNWGGNWRMPTYKERDELINTQYTKWTLTTVNGVIGYLVESIVTGYEGNSIFLPIAGYCHGSKKEDAVGEKGYYITKNLYTSNPSNAYFLLLTTDHFSTGGTARYFGTSVRAVVSRCDLR